MEQGPFRLLIWVIVAGILVAIFLLFIAPSYFWKQDPVQAVEKNLEKAETQLGKYATQEGDFWSGYAVEASAFESAHRSIVFNCNSELNCCGQGEDCGKNIEWDNQGKKRYFSFKEAKKATVSARCRHEEIYICRVYIGEEPAQVDIIRLELDAEEVDLSQKNSIKAGFNVKNSGRKAMIAVKAIARLYKKQPGEGGEMERVLMGEFSKEFPLGIGEEHSDELEIEIMENGTYEVEITLQEKTDETNYETRVFEVKAFGKVETIGCVAGKMEVQELEKCVYRLPCKCNSITECRQMWISRLGIEDERELELVSVNEAEEEVVLEYRAEYEIPEWCDPDTMECKGACFEVPEPECAVSACRNDWDNCRVWLPCECEAGASFDKCIELWREKLGDKQFRTGAYRGKNSLYIDGQIRKQTQYFCDECGGYVPMVIECCDLPTADNCGGTQCEEPPKQPQVQQPQQPQPEKQPEQPQKQECLEGEPRVLQCINWKEKCVQIFPCICMTYNECKQAWENRMRAEWNIQGVLSFVPYNYQGGTVPAIMGLEIEECPWCEEKYQDCRFNFMAEEKCINYT